MRKIAENHKGTKSTKSFSDFFVPLWLKNQKGFSLVELMVAIVVLLIFITFVVGEFSNALLIARRERGLADRDAQVRRAIQLMTSELSQAGVTPEYTINPADPLSDGTQIQGTMVAGTNIIPFKGNGAGIYPGRPITLTLPETDATSEALVIKQVNSGCTPSPCAVTTQNATQSHLANDYFYSPMLPIPFGVLNPPPLTSGTPPRVPLTTTQKSVGNNSQPLTRIGFVGDIFGDGTLRYIEYSWNPNLFILYRSETPISQSTKNPPTILLEFVTAVSFTINYPDTSTPIPTSIQISLTVLSSSPDLKVGGGKRLIPLNTTTLVMPRGTASAAQIFRISGEGRLRAMLAPCQTTGSPAVNRFPPCDSWSTTATPLWDWWSNVYQFTQTAGYTGQTPAALQ